MSYFYAQNNEAEQLDNQFIECLNIEVVK